MAELEPAVPARNDDSVVPGHVECRTPTSRLSVRTVGFEPTISWPPARRDTRLRYALPSSNDPCGIRTQPGQLAVLFSWGLATSPEVERAVCVDVPSLCSGEPDLLEVGWKALESFSPGLQPGAKPSQLPAHLCVLHAFSATKKPGVLCVTPGFGKLAEGLRPMSRAQGIRTAFERTPSATQTCTPRIASKWLLEIGTHGLRCEQIRPGL